VGFGSAGASGGRHDVFGARAAASILRLDHFVEEIAQLTELRV
jgi:hypothetical protein